VASLAARFGRIAHWIDAHAGLLALAIILAGGALRVYVAGLTCLDGDEAWHAISANQETLAESFLRSRDHTHPPLLILALHYWMYLGHSELLLRLLPILAGTASLWFAFRWLRELASIGAALLGVTLLSFCPMLIVLTSEVRQYSFLLLFQFAALYYLERMLKEQNAWLALTHALFLALALLSHYSAIWLIVAAGAYVLQQAARGRLPRNVTRTWLLSQVPLALAGLYLYLTHIANLELTSTGWVEYGFYHLGKEDVTAFLLSGTVFVFNYLFTLGVVGNVMLGLYLLGLIFIVRGDCLPGRKGSALLFLLPIVLGGLAGIIHIYPYGGSRQDAYLYPFVVAPIVVSAAFVGRHFPALLLVAMLALTLAWTIKGVAAFAPDGSRRNGPQVMPAAMEYIETSVPPDALIFCDRHSYCVLSFYLGEARPSMTMEPEYLQSRCGARRTMAPRAAWEFTAHDWNSYLEQMARDHDLRPGDSIWVFHFGWTDLPRSRAILHSLPDSSQATLKSLSETIFMFRVELPTRPHAPARGSAQVPQVGEHFNHVQAILKSRRGWHLAWQGQRRLGCTDVRQVAFNNGQFAGVEPDQATALAGVHDRVAAAEVGVGFHRVRAARAVQDAFQLGAVERLHDLFVGAVMHAALVDNLGKNHGRGQEAPARRAVADALAVDQRGLQREMADGTIGVGRLPERTYAVAGFFREVKVAAVRAEKMPAVACWLHRRAAIGAVHVHASPWSFPGEA
jgi:hypothetical protein